MRWLSRLKKKEEVPSNVLEMMDHTVKFMMGLKAMGGFGYVLFGAGFLFLIAAVLIGARIAQDILNWLMPLAVVLVCLGVVFVIIERFMAFKMAQLKLQMIISVTQQVIASAIPKDHPIDTKIMESIIKDVLKEIWGMWVPDSGEPPARREKSPSS